MLSDIFHLDRRLALANQRLQGDSATYARIEELIDGLLSAYAAHHALSASGIVAAYDTFSRVFAGHLEQFRQQRLYPLEYAAPAPVDRLTYDISLLLSCMVNSARFRIIEKLLRCLQQQMAATDIGVIGCGAGIELEILRQTNPACHVTAYDTDLGDFVRQRFSTWDLRQHTFDSTCPANSFDTILAIEMLEHVADPLALMQHIFAALRPGGICFCTTATDLPQFDHRYNFTDIPLFQLQLQSLGFSILETVTFIQPYPFQGMESRNDWFTLQKNPVA
jgi:SAM-dependent methyltransferase